MNTLTDGELTALAELSLGRILRMGSRPEQPGDLQEYDKYRNLFMDAADEIKLRHATA